MRHAKDSFSSVRAFTLIELLVVIGIIAVLAGGIGLALRDNNPGSALRSAQGLALSSLSAARGQAAISQNNAELIVQADNTNDNFLRSIRVVVYDTSVSGNWRQVGGEILLPVGVYVVPPSTITGVTFDSTNGAWTTKQSTFLASGALPSLSAGDGAKLLISNAVTSLGTVTQGGRIVVATARKSGANSIVFDNPASVRALEISRYGVASLINEADSL